MAVAPRVRRFTVDEYERMLDAGVLAPDVHVELIEGEVVDMAPIGDPHASVVDRLNKFLVSRVGDHAIVRVQSHVTFRPLKSRPQPDLALLRPNPGFYQLSAPTARDIFLVIEVMDTSHEYDRGRKARMYARAGVGELWLVDVPQRIVEVRRAPWEAAYGEVRVVSGDQTVSPSAFRDITLSLTDIFG